MTQYRDYAGRTFPTIDELADYRGTIQAPLLGGAVCPAAEYTFATSEDNGATWRNPSEETKEALQRAVGEQPGCCRNLGDECPLKSSEPG